MEQLEHARVAVKIFWKKLVLRNVLEKAEKTICYWIAIKGMLELYLKNIPSLNVSWILGKIYQVNLHWKHLWTAPSEINSEECLPREIIKKGTLKQKV